MNEKLLRRLKDNDPTLTELNLSHQLSSNQVFTLLEALNENEYLRVLDISGVNVSLDQIMHLLRRNYSLVNITADELAHVELTQDQLGNIRHFGDLYSENNRSVKINAYLTRNKMIEENFKILDEFQLNREIDENLIDTALINLRELIPGLLVRYHNARDLVGEKYRLLTAFRELQSPYGHPLRLLNNTFRHPELAKAASLIQRDRRLATSHYKHAIDLIRNSRFNTPLEVIQLMQDDVLKKNNATDIKQFISKLKINSEKKVQVDFINERIKWLNENINEADVDYNTQVNYHEVLKSFEDFKQQLTQLENYFYENIDVVAGYVNKGHDDSGIAFYQIIGGPNTRFIRQEDTYSFSAVTPLSWLRPSEKENVLKRCFANLQRDAMGTFKFDTHRARTISVLMSTSHEDPDSMALTIAGLGNCMAFFVEISQEGQLLSCELLNTLHTPDNPEELARVISQGGDRNEVMPHLTTRSFVATDDEDPTEIQTPDVALRQFPISKNRQFVMLFSSGMVRASPRELGVNPKARLEAYLAAKIKTLLAESRRVTADSLVRELPHLAMKDRSDDNITALAYEFPKIVQVPLFLMNINDEFDGTTISTLLKDRMSQRLITSLSPDSLELNQCLDDVLTVFRQSGGLDQQNVLDALRKMEEIFPDIETDTSIMREIYRFLTAIGYLKWPKTTEEQILGWQYLTEPFDYREVDALAELMIGNVLMTHKEFEESEVRRAKDQWLLHTLRNVLYRSDLSSVISQTIFRLRNPAEKGFRKIEMKDVTDGHQLISYDRLLEIADNALRHAKLKSPEVKLLLEIIQHSTYDPLHIKYLLKSQGFLTECLREYPAGTTFCVLEDFLLNPEQENLAYFQLPEKEKILSTEDDVHTEHLAEIEKTKAVGKFELFATELVTFKQRVISQLFVSTSSTHEKQVAELPEHAEETLPERPGMRFFGEPLRERPPSKDAYTIFYGTLYEAYKEESPLVVALLAWHLMHTENPVQLNFAKQFFPDESDEKALKTFLSDSEELLADILFDNLYSREEVVAIWRILKQSAQDLDADTAIAAIQATMQQRPK